MKLSRLSNRQLRRLLAQGEVRFATDPRDVASVLKVINVNMKRMERELSKLFSSYFQSTDGVNNIERLRGTESLKKYEKLKSDSNKLFRDMIDLSNYANRESTKYKKQVSKF